MEQAKSNVLKRSSIGTIFMVMAMLVMVIIQLPPFMLDMFFSFNITISLLILMVSLSIVEPLEFSIFPTILLVTTLLRLTLNIASTRVVLLHGNEGTQAAGEIIRAFGEVVIGGNFVVGLIVFAILMIINFIVVTKGAGRISEVSARFTLDALPGKQMAIDADVGAGVVTQQEAKEMRKSLMQEADFYGAMDGASKFVRGDAVASLLILVINLLGGIAIGVFQHGMSFSDSARTFAILTIGDGLVAQIPALLLSIAAALIVTRVSSDQNISDQTVSQVFRNSKPIFLSAVVLSCLAVIPQMPHTPLLAFASLLFFSGYVFSEKQKTQTATETGDGHQNSEVLDDESEEIGWSDVASTDRVVLEIGYGLIHLVGVNQDGALISRIKGIRKKLSKDLGFLIPSIRVRDNLDLPSNHYVFSLKGVQIAKASVQPGKLLAISSGPVSGQLKGVACKEPTFGLDGYWISSGQREYAQGLGYTVVDESTVIATHINHLLKTNASHVFGYNETHELVNNLMKTEPKLCESLTSGASAVPMNTIVTVLQKLLQSGIPLIDFRTTAETMIDAWSKVKEQDKLVESVRISLKQLIVYSICGSQHELPVAVLDNELTHILLKSVQVNQSANEKMVVLEPTLTENIYNRLLEYIQKCEVQSLPSILLLNNELRGLIEKLFKPSIPNLHFLSYSEIPEEKQIKVIQRIGS
tara:strand:- start:1033 stop:3123 length:2091 start_codon:yes stop_codon:yes gene_type:complete